MSSTSPTASGAGTGHHGHNQNHNQHPTLAAHRLSGDSSASSSGGGGSTSNNLRPTSLYSDTAVNYPGSSHNANLPPMPSSASALGLGGGGGSGGGQPQQRPASDLFTNPSHSSSHVHNAANYMMPPGSAGLPPPHLSIHGPSTGGGGGSGGATTHAALDAYYRQIERAERMLEEMRHAQLDAAFTEELRAIEEWFKVLTEVERTTALYALLQYMTPVQIRFFATVLNSMARRADPAAMFGPAPGLVVPDRVDSRPTSIIESELSAMSAFSVDALRDQLAALSTHQGAAGGATGQRTSGSSLAPNSATRPQRYSDLDPRSVHQQRYSDMDAGAFADHGPRSALPPGSRQGAYDMSGWQSVPGSAGLHAPAGYGSNAGGPPLTPFADHPSAAQMGGLDRSQSPHPSHRHSHDDNAQGGQLHPSRTAANWRSNSRPGSPALHASQAPPRAVSPMPPGSAPRSASLQQPQGQGQNGGGQPGFNRMRSPAPPGQSAAGGVPTVRTPASPGFGPSVPPGMRSAPPMHRPASGHGHRRTPSGRHGRGDSFGGHGSVPNSPGFGPHGPVSPSHGGFAAGGPKPPEVVDVDLLKTDIPAWLRSLRLHKYTPILENIPWQKMVLLSDSELAQLGVSAQGARAKFLKVFAHVNAEMNVANTASAADPSANGNGDASQTPEEGQV